MSTTRSGAFVAVLFAACGPTGRSAPSAVPIGRAPSAATATEPTSASAAPLPATTMRFEIVRATGLPGAPPWPITELAPDGTVTIEAAVIGRLDPSGVFTAPDGTPIARLDRERLVVGDRPTDGTIDDAGTLRNGSGDDIRVELDGRVHGTHPDAPELRVTPITPETRRTAMYVVALGLLVRSDGSVSVSGAVRP